MAIRLLANDRVQAVRTKDEEYMADVNEHSPATHGYTLEIQMAIAALRTAEAAIREEPYERLPALAGSLAIAASRLEAMPMLAEIADKLRRIDWCIGYELREVDHETLEDARQLAFKSYDEFGV